MEIETINYFRCLNIAFLLLLAINEKMPSQFYLSGFDDLPIVICFQIFRFLNVHNLFNLRLVCKKFYQSLKVFKICELIFHNHDSLSLFRTNWAFVNQPISQLNSLSITYQPLLKAKPLFEINLKRLRINCEKNKIEINDLNKFHELEHLEMDTFCLKTENNKLSLNNLKILTIKFFEIKTSIEVDAPNLNSLNINCKPSDSIKFNYPLSVKKLQCHLFIDDFKIFENVEYLNVFSNLNSQTLQTILSFLKLEELHIQTDLLNIVPEIQKDCKLKRRNLKVYARGLLRFNGKKSVDYALNSRDLEGERYLLLSKCASNVADNLEIIDQIKYLDLMNCINFKLPASFFQKFSCIRTISIDKKVEDQNLLISFIKQCASLSNLKFKNTKLPQQFYTQLPSNSSLNYLLIKEAEEIELNFEFINKMFNLIELITNLELRLNSNYDLNRLNLLLRLDFKLESYTVLIEKSGRDKYNGYCHDNDRLIQKIQKMNHIKLIKRCVDWKENYPKIPRKRCLIT